MLRIVEPTPPTPPTPFHDAIGLILGLDPTTIMPKALAAAFRVSTNSITRSSSSFGAKELTHRFNIFDLSILNEYKIILSKKEGCQFIKESGVIRLSDNFLNAKINNTTYNKNFQRKVSEYNGKGRAKIVLTYAEIIYFYTQVLGRNVPSILTFPNSLVSLADEGDRLFP